MAKVKKEKVLLTGATGFIGANLLKSLVEKGFDISIISRKYSNLWRIEHLLPKITNIQGDLTNPKSTATIVKKVKPQIIFHLANLGVYKGIQPGAKETIEVNLIGTINLLEATNTLDYKCFVNTGSSSEYGPKNKIMDENDDCEPNTIYGFSKLASTYYCSQVARRLNKPIVTLRLFSPYGPYDDPRRLINYAITRALANKPIKLTNPESVRDYIFVDDVVNAYFIAIKRAYRYKGEIFNIGSSRQMKVKNVVAKIVKLSNSKSKIVLGKVPLRLQESPKWQANIEKARKKLAWQPTSSFDEGMKRTILWFKQYNAHHD